jgi:hypothetical protein
MQLCFSDDRFMAVIPPSSVSKMQTRLGLLYLADSGVRWVAEHSSNKTNPGATSQAKKSESWMSYFCRWEGARILQTCQESCNFGHGKRDLSNWRQGQRSRVSQEALPPKRINKIIQKEIKLWAEPQTANTAFKWSTTQSETRIKNHLLLGHCDQSRPILGLRHGTHVNRFKRAKHKCSEKVRRDWRKQKVQSSDVEAAPSRNMWSHPKQTSPQRWQASRPNESAKNALPPFLMRQKHQDAFQGFLLCTLVFTASTGVTIKKTSAQQRAPDKQNWSWLATSTCCSRSMGDLPRGKILDPMEHAGVLPLSIDLVTWQKVTGKSSSAKPGNSG